MPTYTKSICLFPNRTHARTHTHTHSLSLSCTQHWCPSDTFFLLAHSQITLSLSFTQTHVLLLSLSLSFKKISFSLFFVSYIISVRACVRACAFLSWRRERSDVTKWKGPYARTHYTHTHALSHARVHVQLHLPLLQMKIFLVFGDSASAHRKTSFGKKIHIRSKAYRYGFAPRKLSRVIN